jgi:hypothetical protein
MSMPTSFVTRESAHPSTFDTTGSSWFIR